MKAFFIALALFCSATLYAQPAQVRPTRSDFSTTPPNTTTAPPNLPPDFPNEPSFPWEIFKQRHKTETDRTHTYYIQMKDSAQWSVEGKIMLDSNGYYLTWTDTTVKRSDPQRIKNLYPAQTLSIIRHDEEDRTSLEGQPVGAAWLFTAIKGKLTVYATAAETDLPDESLLYIRVGDGPIQNLNPEMLEKLLQGDEKALQLLRKGKIRKAIEQYDAAVRSPIQN